MRLSSHIGLKAAPALRGGGMRFENFYRHYAIAAGHPRQLEFAGMNSPFMTKVSAPSFAPSPMTAL